jgi:hypothetical protein
VPSEPAQAWPPPLHSDIAASLAERDDGARTGSRPGGVFLCRVIEFSTEAVASVANFGADQPLGLVQTTPEAD